MDKKERVISFIRTNGWKEETYPGNDYQTFIRDAYSIAIDINDKEIVLVVDSGDFLYLPVNVCALLGALLHCRAISVEYDFPKEMR